MKRIITVVLLLISCAGFAQIKISALPVATGDSGFLPIVQGGVTKKIWRDSLVRSVKIDTQFLRRDINLKVNYTDTAAMLLAYRNAINLKVNISDTAAMLNAYKTAINLKLNSTDTQYLRRDININTSQSIANAAAIQQRTDSAINDAGYLSIRKGNQFYRQFLLPTSGGGASNWTLTGADITNNNTGDVGIGTLPRYSGYFDVNKNFNVQGASAGNYMRYVPSVGRLILLSNTVDPIINISKDNTGNSDFLSMFDNISGGYMNFGSGGSSFLPIIKMSAGSSSNDFAGFQINTRDVSTTAAFGIDARKAGGELVNQPLMAVKSFGNEKLTVLANGNIKIPILSTSLTAPLTTGTTKMVIVDQFGMFSNVAIPTGGGTATDTSFLRRDINLNTTAITTKLNITDTANIRLRAIAGTNTTITGTYPNLTFNSTGGGGTVYTGATPIVVTGSIISADTSKSAGKLATFSDVQSATNSWKLTGNTGTNATTDFLGTTDAQDLVFKTNNLERMRISAGGATTANSLAISNQNAFQMTNAYAYYYMGTGGGSFFGSGGDIMGVGGSGADFAFRTGANGFIFGNGTNSNHILKQGAALFTDNAASTSLITVASAVGEFRSTTKGVLLPRLTTTQINAIASPANGLTVYNTTLSTLCFFNGTTWQRVTTTAM